MTTTEAIAKLEEMQRQIIHGSNVFGDMAELMRGLVIEIERLRESHTMQLAAISTASLENIESSVKARIDRENPYWTVAYDDVCRAVDREMKHRNTLERERPAVTVALCVNIARRLRDLDGFVDAVDEAADLIEWVGQTPGLLTIAAERHRHLEEEGWTAVHDDGHHRGELAYAAFCYCQAAAFQQSASLEPKRRSNWWPWEDQWWKPSDDPERNLVKAGALILAEIARRRRLAAGQPQPGTPENAVCACGHLKLDHSESGCLARSCGCEQFTARRPDAQTGGEAPRPRA